MKKAVTSMAFIVGVVATLVAFMIIGASIRTFMEKAEPKEIELLCHDSVALRAAAQLNLGDLTNAKIAPLLCQTQDRKISGNADKIKKELAEMITRCWWMFNSGTSENIISTLSGTGGKNRGFVCYTAIVEESSEFRQTDAFNDFHDYLRKQKYSKVNYTYLEYVQYAAGGPGRIMMFLEDGKIQPNHAYEIAYIEKNKKESTYLGKVLGIGGAVIGVTGLVVLTVGTGGAGAVVALAGVVGGTAAAAVGAEIALDELLKESDVSTIMVVDMSDKELRTKLHQDVFVGDIQGE